MLRIASLHIRPTSINILTENRLTLDDAKIIANNFREIGIEVVVYNIGIVFDRDKPMYEVEVPVTEGFRHRDIIDRIRGYRWIAPEILSQYEDELTQASVVFENILKTKQEINLSQREVCEFLIEPYVEEIIEKCNNRDMASAVLKWARYDIDDNQGMVSYNLQKFPANERSLIKEALKFLQKIYYRDNAFISTFESHGSFLPHQEQLRRVFLDFIERKIDEKFGAEILSDEKKRTNLLFALFFIRNVESRFYSPDKQEIYDEVNRQFSHLKPLDANPFNWRYTSRVRVSIFDKPSSSPVSSSSNNSPPSPRM